MTDFKAELGRRKAANEFKMMRGCAHHKEDMKINEQERQGNVKPLESREDGYSQ